MYNHVLYHLLFGKYASKEIPKSLLFGNISAMVDFETGFMASPDTLRLLKKILAPSLPIEIAQDFQLLRRSYIRHMLTTMNVVHGFNTTDLSVGFLLKETNQIIINGLYFPFLLEYSYRCPILNLGPNFESMLYYINQAQLLLILPPQELSAWPHYRYPI